VAKKIIRTIPAAPLSEAELEAGYSAVKGNYEGRIRNLFAACDEKREMYYRVTAAVHYLIDNLDSVSADIAQAHAIAKQDGDRPKMEALKFFYDSVDARRESLIEDIAKAASGEIADATIAKMREESDVSLLEIHEVPEPAEEAAEVPAETPAEPASEETQTDLSKPPRKTKRSKP